MKGKLLIVFKSAHGYVKRYVDIIGNALGCDAVPADKVRADMFGAYDKILFISALRGYSPVGMNKFAKYVEAIYKKLIVCGVGVAPFSRDIPARIKDASISVMYEKFVPVFYARGGFDFEELSRTEKMGVTLTLRRINMSEVLDDSDTAFKNAAAQPFDDVKRENIQPLIDYLDGKPVNAELFSPPEITDPEQEKQFFDEMEKAANAPDDAKRALKKKLKK
ncbi:MAG: dienelactone hydrolase family protein [Roseburia sp.]|nr:dienelactone hydrolase family protein [Roseburia sp.]